MSVLAVLSFLGHSCAMDHRLWDKFVLLFLESQEHSGSADQAQICSAGRCRLHLLQAAVSSRDMHESRGCLGAALGIPVDRAV